jgi:hypothetical protein
MQPVVQFNRLINLIHRCIKYLNVAVLACRACWASASQLITRISSACWCALNPFDCCCPQHDPCRSLIYLYVTGQHIRALPPLPAQLQYLYVSGCKDLQSPAVLPPTLQELYCDDCTALSALPSSLHSTAVTDLNCIGRISMQRLPHLPESLQDLDVEECHSLKEVCMTVLATACCSACQQLATGSKDAACTEHSGLYYSLRGTPLTVFAAAGLHACSSESWPHAHLEEPTHQRGGEANGAALMCLATCGVWC